MSNASSLADTVAAFSGPYLLWLEKDVLPIITGTVLLCVFLCGFVLNSLTIHAIRKKRITSLCKHLFLQLVALDFVAYSFLLLPVIITSFAKDWVLSDALCQISGALGTTCFICVFIFLTFMCAERMVKMNNPSVYDGFFGNTCICVIISVVTWALAFTGSMLPTAGWGTLKYISYQNRCNLQHSKNTINMNLIFFFGMFLPTFLALLFCIGTFLQRKEILKSLTSLKSYVNNVNVKVERKSRENGATENIKLGEIVSDEYETVPEVENVNRALTAAEIEVKQPNSSSPDRMSVTSPINERPNSRNSVSPIPGSQSTRSEKEMRKDLIRGGVSGDETRLKTRRVASTVYKRSMEQVDFHLAATYVLILGIVFILWLPYVIVCYLDVYDTTYIWGGWYSIVLIISDISYCIKPIVFMSHNHLFRKATSDAVPESLRTRAIRAKRVLSKTARKVDGVIFLKMGDDARTPIILK